MKYKLIILLVAITQFCFNCLTLVGQQPQAYFKLDSTLKDTKIYLARDYITLQPGFSYTATGSNFLNAKVDNCLLFPPTVNNYATNDGTITNSDQGGVVGTIPGNFNVSAIGAASYVVPIEVVAGFGGIQPNINLSYDSQCGNGLMGYGWNIVGLSAICKAPKNMYFDNKVTGTIWGDDSPLMLDGQRLIYDSNNLYKLEGDVTKKIEKKVDPADGSIYFKVYTKEGLEITYGQTMSSKNYLLFDKALANKGNIFSTWQVNRIENKNGAYVEYNYENEIAWMQANFLGFKNFRISSIQYGHNEIGVIGEVKFEYENRTDKIEGYVQGYKYLTDKRLLNVIVKSKNTQLRKYTMSYDKNKEFSLLTAVSLTGFDGTKYNSTVFEYPSQTLTEGSFKIDPVGFKVAFNPTAMGTADFTGDGVKDLYYFTIGESWRYGSDATYELGLMINYRKKENNNSSTLSSNLALRWDFGESIGKITQHGSGVYGVKQFSANLGDFYGDGLTSIAKFRVGRDENLNAVYQLVFLSLKDGKLTTSEWYSNISISPGNKESVAPYFITGEFDGKSGSEALIINELAEGIVGGYQYTAKMVKNQGKDVDCFYIKTTKKIKNIISGQFSGNGKSDLLLVFSDSNSLLTNSYDGTNYFSNALTGNTVFLSGFKDGDIYSEGNFNQDNLPDFVYRTGTKDWHIAYNKGDGTSTVVDQSFLCENYKDGESSSDRDHDGVYVADLNYDGYDDIILADELLKQDHDLWDKWWVYDKTNWKIYKQTNNQFILSLEYYNKDRSDGCFGYGDLLGDGRNRFLKCSGEGQLAEYFDAGYVGTPYLLSSVTNGIGQKTTINYRGLAKIGFDDSNLVLGSDFYQYRSLDFKVINNYSDGLNKIEMDYNGAVVDKRGRGLLGFMTIKATDKNTNIISTTTNTLNNTFGLLVPQEQKVSKLYASDIKTVSTDYEVKDLGSKCYQLLLKSRITRDKLTSLVITESFIDQGKPAYDKWGNPKIITTTKGGQTTIQRINYISKGTWSDISGVGCDNKIRDITTTIGSTSRINQYIYSDKGNLLQEIHDFGDKNQVTTSYPQEEYDAFGNPKLITITANGRTQSTRMTYLSGRFLESKKNLELGTSISYKYNEIRALRTSLIDEANNTTTYTYDGFDRLTLTIYPNKVQSVTSLQWVGKDPNKPANAIYYQYDETSGSAPSITWYDINGREIRKDNKGLGGKEIQTTIEYNNIGKVWRISKPYFKGDNATKIYSSVYEYDGYGRISSIVTPMGTTSYQYDLLKTTVSSPEGTSETTLNAVGQVEKVITNGKSVSYEYWPNGLVKKATPEGGQPVETSYDLQGNRTQLSDPDAGIIKSEYNGWGQLLWSEQKKNASSTIKLRTDYAYSPTTGVLDSTTVKGSASEVTSYIYDKLQRISSISIAKQHTQEFIYDNYGRVTEVTETLESNKKFTKKTVYDAFGRIAKEYYPYDYYIINGYDQYGNLVSVTDKNGKNIWQASEANADGMLTKTLQGGREIIYGYDQRGLPTSVFSSNIISMSYFFDDNGNLEQRTDALSKQYEKFTYDKLNRLVSWNVYKDNKLAKENSIVYSYCQGNIISKSDIGFNMNYGEEKQPPHALTSIDGNPALVSDNLQQITYTAFNKIGTITEGDNSLTLTYGVDQQRRKGVFKINGSSFTRYYLGNYEEEVANDGTVRKLYYISGGNGLAAIYEQVGSSSKLYYCYSDYQGNLLAITDDKGELKEQMAYDPWGARRNPLDWSQPDVRASHLIARGYTLHEHLDAFGLINMNGRAYDPVVARFLSPDPFVQAPENWLNYNRFGYCYNNPFRYNDPSGNIIAAILAPLVANYVIGGLNNWINGHQSFGSAFGRNAFWGTSYNLQITTNQVPIEETLVFTKVCEEAGINPSDPILGTDENLKKYFRLWFPDVSIDKEAAFTVDNVPKYYKDLMKNQGAAGVTPGYSRNKTYTGKYDVYFNRELAFKSARSLYYAIGHELVHVYQWKALKGLPYQDGSITFPGERKAFTFVDLLEYGAYSYQKKMGGMNMDLYIKDYMLIDFEKKWPGMLKITDFSNFIWTNSPLPKQFAK